MIVEERIRDEAHVIQLGEKIEQWVAGLPDQHFIARIAEQPEEETVGFAGTGSQKDLIGIDGGCVVTIVEADGLARAVRKPLGSGSYSSAAGLRRGARIDSAS